MITLVVFFGLLFAGLPIAGTILVSAIVFMFSSDLGVLYDSIPIQFYGALEINSLLAIPLFLLVGEIMNKGGLTQRLIAVAQVLVGGLKGGLAYANLFTNATTSYVGRSAVQRAGHPASLWAGARRRGPRVRQQSRRDGERSRAAARVQPRAPCPPAHAWRLHPAPNRAASRLDAGASAAGVRRSSA